MSSPIAITPQDLSDGVRNTTNANENISAELTVLRSYIEDLGGMWLGVSSQQFRNLMTDFDTYSKMLQDALTGISDGLQGNYRNYQTSEVQNRQNLVTVNGAIPGANLG